MLKNLLLKLTLQLRGREHELMRLWRKGKRPFFRVLSYILVGVMSFVYGSLFTSPPSGPEYIRALPAQQALAYLVGDGTVSFMSHYMYWGVWAVPLLGFFFAIFCYKESKRKNIFA